MFLNFSRINNKNKIKLKEDLVREEERRARGGTGGAAAPRQDEMLRVSGFTQRSIKQSHK